MQLQIPKLVGCLALMLFLQGCTISQNVVPVDASKQISKIYLQKNDKVLMEEFHPELLKQLNELGFETESYSAEPPKQANYYINYTANWMWDMAMYLYYFKATVYEQAKEAGFSKVVGEVEYDAKMGGANMNKFGHTADKIRPLLQQLFAKVRRKSN